MLGGVAPFVAKIQQSWKPRKGELDKFLLVTAKKRPQRACAAAGAGGGKVLGGRAPRAFDGKKRRKLLAAQCMEWK